MIAADARIKASMRGGGEKGETPLERLLFVAIVRLQLQTGI